MTLLTRKNPKRKLPCWRPIVKTKSKAWNKKAQRYIDEYIIKHQAELERRMARAWRELWLNGETKF